MIDEEYAELQEIEDGKLFNKKFGKRFRRYEIEIRRSYIADPDAGGFVTTQRYYKSFTKKLLILPTTKNISSRTGTSEQTKSNGTRVKVSNFVLYSTLILLNNEGRRQYTDLLMINGLPHRAVITQRYNAIIPHIEYQLEAYAVDVELINDTDNAVDDIGGGRGLTKKAFDGL